MNPVKTIYSSRLHFVDSYEEILNTDDDFYNILAFSFDEKREN
ncbi:hypothetical protein JTS96_05030 [Clostridium botulinum]|nr:hypothetical protein [Clostridium botulinum]